MNQIKLFLQVIPTLLLDTVFIWFSGFSFFLSTQILLRVSFFRTIKIIVLMRLELVSIVVLAVWKLHSVLFILLVMHNSYFQTFPKPLISLLGHVHRELSLFCSVFRIFKSILINSHYVSSLHALNHSMTDSNTFFFCNYVPTHINTSLYSKRQY